MSSEVFLLQAISYELYLPACIVLFAICASYCTVPVFYDHLGYVTRWYSKFAYGYNTWEPFLTVEYSCSLSVTYNLTESDHCAWRRMLL